MWSRISKVKISGIFIRLPDKLLLDLFSHCGYIKQFRGTSESSELVVSPALRGAKPRKSSIFGFASRIYSNKVSYYA
jgi:hypothetical protein